MRRFSSFLIAAAVAVSSVAPSVGPAQAASTRALPAAALDSRANVELQQVSHRREARRWKRKRDRAWKQHHHHQVKRYYCYAYEWCPYKPRPGIVIKIIIR